MGKILAVDYGTKNIGLAITDENQIMAFRYDTLKYKSDEKFISDLKRIIKIEDVDKIIIGIPLGYNEKPTQMSEKINSFITSLTEKINIPAIKINESMSSRTAKLNSDKHKINKNISIDQESARIMLQDYLSAIN